MSFHRTAMLGLFALSAASTAARAQITTSPLPVCPTGYVQAPNDVPGPDLQPSMALATQALSQGRAHIAYAAALPLAEANNAKAQFLVGTQLMTGCGVTRDQKAAAEWLLKAAQNGEVNAAGALSNAYSKGTGVEVDDREAFKWMTVVAQSGNPVAQVDLSLMYLTGRGVAQDGYEGLKWAIKGAEQGNAGGLFNVAMAYRNGNALPKSLEDAVLWESAAFDRASAAQKTRYDTIMRADSGKLSVDEVERLKDKARAWTPGPGSLAKVLKQADPKYKPSP